MDALDIRDELVRLAEHDSAAFCRLLHDAADDLKGAKYRRDAGPYARAAREAGFALAEAALRYGREADEVAAASAAA